MLKPKQIAKTERFEVTVQSTNLHANVIVHTLENDGTSMQREMPKIGQVCRTKRQVTDALSSKFSLTGRF